MEELSILRKISSGHQAMLGENHALPMLRELEHEDMAFGIFPAVSSRIHVPWFENADQAFNAIIQILEARDLIRVNKPARLRLLASCPFPVQTRT